jgi:hypothetical protein
MSEKIEPALSAALWAHLAKHKDNQSFATIVLEGGYNDELGAVGERDAEPWEITQSMDSDDGKRDAAAIATLNAHLPDGDPRKITRGMVDWLRCLARQMRFDGPKWANDAANMDRLIDALESYLPPEGAA